MKKVLLMIVIGGAIALTSCSKTDDYTCSCVYTVVEDGVVTDTDTQIFSYLDQKEEDAEDLCEANESSFTAPEFGFGENSEKNVCTLN